MVRRKIAGIAGSVGVLVTLGAVAAFNYIGIDNSDNTQDVEKQAFAAEMLDGDLSSLLVNCSSVKVTDVTTTCLFDLIPDQDLPTAGLKIGVGDVSGVDMDSSTCALVSGQQVQCTNVPIGTLSGMQNIKAKISAAPVDTMTRVFIQPAQSIGGEAYFEYTLADGGDSAPKGSSAPLFKSPDDVVATIKGLKTDHGDVPGEAGNPYTCVVEARTMKNWDDGSAWTTLDPITDNSYHETDGCSVTLPKQVRGTLLNWSLRATITNSTTGDVYYAYDNYIFTFAGSGA